MRKSKKPKSTPKSKPKSKGREWKVKSDIPLKIEAQLKTKSNFVFRFVRILGRIRCPHVTHQPRDPKIIQLPKKKKKSLGTFFFNSGAILWEYRFCALTSGMRPMV